MKRLQRMLDAAVEKRQRLDALKSGKAGEEGAAMLQQELWADALDSVAGATTVLDTGKLRKAIKKREKKKQVSARQWKERIDAVEEGKAARLQKRDENIARKKGGSAVAAAAAAGDDRGGEKSSAPPGADKAAKGPGRAKFGPPNGKGKGPHAPPNRKGAGFEGKTNAGFLNKAKTNHKK
jgi:hypothetical protein